MMKSFLKPILDLLYPKPESCYACGKKGEGKLCGACIASIAFIEGRSCTGCGKSLNESYESSYCPDCMAAGYAFVRTFACFDYAGTGKHLLHRLKYEGEAGIADMLAKWACRKLIPENLKFDAVVPVPMHEGKRRLRGYNQAALIAGAMGRRLHIPFSDCLERVRETKEQYGLDKAQRILNIDGAFSTKFGYNVGKYNCVLLVDDIYTTGSTVNECSKVLKKAGVRKIYVIAAATGSNT